MPSVLIFPDLLEQRDKPAPCRLHHGGGIADDLRHVSVRVDLHAVERHVLRREKIRVLNGNGALTAEITRALPSGDRRAAPAESARKHGKRFRIRDQRTDRKTCQKHRRPRPEKVSSRAKRRQNRQHQRQPGRHRSVNAHHAPRGVGKLQLIDELGHICLRTENAVFSVPRLFLPHGCNGPLHRADGAHRLALCRPQLELAPERRRQFERQHRRKRDAPGDQRRNCVQHRHQHRQRQKARVIKLQLEALQNAVQQHVVGKQHLRCGGSRHHNGQQPRAPRQVDPRDREIAQREHSCRNEAQNNAEDQPQLDRAALAIGAVRLLR